MPQKKPHYLSSQKLIQYRRLSFFSFTFFFLFSILLFVLVLISDYRNFENNFKSEAEKINTQFNYQNKQNEAVLEGFSAFIAGLGQHLNDENLNRYASKIKTRFPHIHMLEIAEAVKDRELSEFILKQRKKGYKDFDVKAFDYSGNRNWRKLSKADIRYPLIYLYPLPDESRKVLGLDMSSHEHLSIPLQRAVSTGNYETSLPFNLIEGKKAYVMFKSSDVGEGKSKLRYVTLLVITLEQLSIDINSKNDSLGVLVFHNSSSKSDATARLFYKKVKSSRFFPMVTYESYIGENKSGYNLIITGKFCFGDLRWHLLILILVVLSLLFYLGNKILMQNLSMHKNAIDELQYKAKAKAISTLTGGIAHEFNNKLSVVRGFLSLISGKIKNDNEILLWIKHADKASELCIALTKRLLTFSRYKGIRERISGVDVNSFISANKDVLSGYLKNTIQLNYKLADDLPLTFLGEDDLKEILIELVKNSNDSINGNGEILITTSQVVLIDSQYVEVGAEVVPGEYLYLSISDTGCGISDEIKMHVFDPFFTTKPIGEGSGMGLATVYGLVKLNNGYINFSSSINKGTTMNIYIPLLLT